MLNKKGKNWKKKNRKKAKETNETEKVPSTSGPGATEKITELLVLLEK